MAKKQAEGLENPVIADEVAERLSTTSERSRRVVDEIVSEEDRLDGIDLQKINDIISAPDIQKGGTIRIERRGEMDDKFAYVAKIPAESFDMDRIKKMYGGGEYYCRTFRANGQMYKTFGFSIDHRIRGQLDESEIKQLAGGDRGSDMNKVLLDAALGNKGPQTLDSNPSFMSRLLETMESKSSQTMMMMMTMMQTMTQSMNSSQEKSTQMMVALLSQPKPASDGGMATVLAEILKQKATVNPLEDMIKMMAMLKEITTGAPAEREPAMWEKMLSAGGPALVGLLTGGRVQPQSPLPEVVAEQPASLPQAPAVQSTTQPQPEMTLGVRAFIGLLLNAAAKNSDPAVYVDMILDNVSDVQLTEIRGHLTDASWPVNVFGADHRAVQFRPWLEELKQMILEPDADTKPSGVESPANSQPVG